MGESQPKNISTGLGTLKAATGVPQAIASSRTKPKVSVRLGNIILRYNIASPWFVNRQHTALQGLDLGPVTTHANDSLA